jgi:hypothetical protein
METRTVKYFIIIFVRTMFRNFTTEASKQYAEKAYNPPARSMKPPREALNTGSFNGETTSATSFRPYEGVAPADPIRMKGSDMRQGNDPFQSETSYGKQFTGQVQPVARSMKPSSDPSYTGEFDSTTTNRYLKNILLYFQ